MKISIIISDISKTGGTERAVTTLANMLCKNSHEVSIISLTRTNEEKSYYDLCDSIHVDFLNNELLPVSFYKKVKWCIVSLILLRSYFKKKNADFIISTGHNNNWLIPFVRGGKQTKTIACEHIVYSSIPVVSKFFMSLTYKYLDHIVVLSEKSKSSFSKYSKISVIPNALPFEVNKQSSLSKEGILIVGRLNSEKGLERLVPIGKILKEKYPLWKISLVGDGEMREELELIYKNADLDDYILFKGIIKDVKSEYLSSSIYVMTSHYEAFPMVLLEAQSCGLPIVAFDCPEGPAQIIHDGKDGFLIKDKDFEGFTDRLSQLIEHEELRHQLGNQGKINSLMYSEENVVNKWEDLLMSF
jgi:glycosyltransferase involved in cell wall biosynthesis